MGDEGEPFPGSSSDIPELTWSAESIKRKLEAEEVLKDDDDPNLTLDEKLSKRRCLTSGLPIPTLKSLPGGSSNEESNGGASDSETKKEEEDEDLGRKIFVGALAPNMNEKPLINYFSKFGKVTDCHVVRDSQSGISKGFAFLTFLCETSTRQILNSSVNHSIEGRTIRVAKAKNKEGSHKNNRNNSHSFDVEDLVIPYDQTKVYIGPLEDSVLASDVKTIFAQYGPLKAINKVRSSKNNAVAYASVDFKQSISVRRVFGRKIFVNGKFVQVACSKFAMELLLNPGVLFFFDAFEYVVDYKLLEKHFSTKYGQVFRAIHVPEKKYGFVDFVHRDSVNKALDDNNKKRLELIPPGQYVKITRNLPFPLLMDFCAIGESDGAKLMKKIDDSVPLSGVYGQKASKFNLAQQAKPTASNDLEKLASTSQVRFPAYLIPKLMGERGKTIAEITRDSQCKITVPKINPDETTIIVTIKGLKKDIKTAQYLMQKAIKNKK